MTPSEKHDDELASAGATSRSLLLHAKLAEPEAWERLVRLYAPLVASWCHRWGVAQQDVADVLQEVFQAVAGHLDRFRKEGPADTFRGWLATIAKNKARDYFRRKSSEPAAIGGSDAALRLAQVLDPHSDTGHSPSEDCADVPSNDQHDDAMFDDVLRRALEAIRGEFHDRTWHAFWGTVVEGRATADVAADLKMQPGAVRVSKSRVLLRLRRELGDFAVQ
jgi:RNA polymerase sigma-70 factor, ECF subfamily